jgi:hypothetical protein
MKIKDTVTGQQQCEHIIGFLLSDFPQFGERDRLVMGSENAVVSTAFCFCPLCVDALPVCPSAKPVLLSRK